MFLLFASCDSANNKSDIKSGGTSSAGTEITEHREGFSVREISDDLFEDYQHFELPTAITEKYSEAYIKK